MSKKLLAVLLVTFFVFFAGCNTRKEKGSAQTYDNLKPSTLEKKDINIYTYGGAVTSSGKDIIEAMLEEIEPATAETIHVALHFFWIPPEKYDTEISRLVQSNEKIDAFTCYSPQAFVDQGLCIGLSELFKQHAPNYYQELAASSIGKEYLSDCSYNGELYAIPNNALKSPRYCIVTRSELADKYAPEGLETLEDYGEFLKRVKENETFTYPGFVMSRYFLRSYLLGNGYFNDMDDFVFYRWDENGKTPYTAEQTPEFLDACELLREWKAKEYIVPNNAKQKYVNLSDGSLASYHTPMEDADNLFAVSPGLTSHLKALPLYMESPHLQTTSAWGLAIAPNCKNPDRVLMLIEWIHSSQKNYDLFTYGVEGTNYILQDEYLTFPRGDVRQLVTWKYYGAGFFEDYRYKRIISGIDPNFLSVYREASLKNVKTYGVSYEQRQKAQEGLERDYDQIRGMVTKYSQNMEYFMQSIDSGSFRISIEELKENQKEAGVDTILDLFRKIRVDSSHGAFLE